MDKTGLRAAHRPAATAWLVALLLAGCSTSKPAVSGRADAEVSAASVGNVAQASQGAEVVTVYKSPTCGCCNAWVDHLRESGFQVETVDEMNMDPIKAKHGVGQHLASCHTATVGGYVVEGHVPAEDIRRLLRERPEVTGLAVPGMPMGSPGMEGPRKDPYDVLAFDKQGKMQVFAKH